MPKNPTNKLFLHKGKKPHVCLGMVIETPGRWGIATIARHCGWDIYDLKKAILKMKDKGLLIIIKRKLYPTESGVMIYSETLEHMTRD